MSAQRYSLAQAASKFFGNDVITECDWTLADVQLDALHASGFKIVREAAKLESLDETALAEASKKASENIRPILEMAGVPPTPEQGEYVCVRKEPTAEMEKHFWRAAGVSRQENWLPTSSFKAAWQAVLRAQREEG